MSKISIGDKVVCTLRRAPDYFARDMTNILAGRKELIIVAIDTDSLPLGYIDNSGNTRWLKEKDVELIEIQ